jgi:outer membrane protein assembly factor BamB
MRFFQQWICAVSLLMGAGVLEASAGDWPMWRYDSGRGSWSPDALPDHLKLQWVRELPQPMPAWPETQPKLQFDAVAQPVVMGERIFVPSSRNDSVTAYSTRSGEELWRFYSNGPVRFAPVASGGRVFFVSDDGELYALDAKDGKLVWKVKGGPDQRRLILGNHRLISSWPARGGVVLHQGKLYFGASVWPFMGIFVRAVDPASGEILWTNSGDGTNFINQPHGGAVAFSGLVPQGHLAASGNKLVIPGGRSVPGVYDAKTGKQLNFAFAEGKKEGGHHVGVTGSLLFADGRAFTLENGLAAGGGAPPVFNTREMLASDPGNLLSRSTEVELVKLEKKDRKGKAVTEIQPKYHQLKQSKLAEKISGQWLMGAGDRFYTGGAGQVAAYEFGKGKPVWEAKLEGEVKTMLAGDGRLFAVTGDGNLYCFAEGEPQGGKVRKIRLEKKELHQEAGDEWKEAVARILGNKGAGEGFALALGIGSGGMIEELLRQSDLRVIALERDAAKVESFRRRMEAAGLYGTRVSVIEGDPLQSGLPVYLCNLIVAEDPKGVGLLAQKGEVPESVFNALRPYGGLLCLVMSDDEHGALARRLDAGTGFAKAEIKRSGGLTFLVRAGALPDSGDWTHQYGNAEQTVVSKDKRVKAPLGILWFGGPSHESVLPRHGHGPSPQVVGGRLFIEGPDMLRAVDVYTGRVLWERSIPGFGEYFNRTDHFAGAGETGSNYVSMEDRVFAMNKKVILELNAADGGVVREYLVKGRKKGDEDPIWGSIRVSGNYLVATAVPLALETDDKKKGGKLETGQGSGSRLMVVYDRRTGEWLWEREAKLNFRHNNIAVSGDRIFCIDRLTEQKEKLLARRGLKFEGEPVLYALDLETGEVVWERKEDVFGTFLNYSSQYDALLQAGSAYRDRAKDEAGKGMMVLRGRDGKELWYDKEMEYSGPCLLWRDKILTNGAGGVGIELLTGRKTGWDYTRTYGCNTAIGSENLLTFRSGSAGFFDLEGDSGTGNLGGFKSSCTANLIAADGVLNAPDYTRTCVCAYQNQTSLALVHMPQAEVWTYGAELGNGRLGINFGAPGDRRSTEGTLFLEYPLVGGESAEMKVEVKGEDVRYSRVHASVVGGSTRAPDWLGASVVEGATTIVVEAGKAGQAMVRLYFSDLDDRGGEGLRIFDVKLQGKVVLEGLDVVKEAGAKAVVVKEFPIELEDDGKLVIGLEAVKGLPVLAGVELLWE